MKMLPPVVDAPCLTTCRADNANAPVSTEVIAAPAVPPPLSSPDVNQKRSGWIELTVLGGMLTAAAGE